MSIRRFSSMLLLLVVVPLMLAPVEAEAHNKVVHEKLVNDAITYIKNSGTPAQRAALNELITVAGGEQQLRDQIAVEARLTDDYEDLSFFSNAKTLAVVIPHVTGGRTFFGVDGHKLTRLQHFLNVDRRPELWKGMEGYYYQWTAKTGKDREAMSSGGWGPFNVAAADLEVDNDYSLALARYQTHWNGSAQQWARNWDYEYDIIPGGDDWDIENTRFAPVSVLAYYWFRRYEEFPIEGARTHLDEVVYRQGQSPIRRPPRKISGAQLLGPALHAAADVTVPQHTMGSNGLGHEAYESDFEDLYMKRVEVNVSAAGVEAHLREREFLQRGLQPVSGQPDNVGTLQVTVVTGDEDGDGTDANVTIDFGPGQAYKLNTSMDNFERWSDDTFTLPVKANTRLSDLRQLRIGRDGKGSVWRLKALYVTVNGVLLYGNSNINRMLKSNEAWSAPNFVPRDTIAKQIWPIDGIMLNAATYTFNYIRNQVGDANFRRAAYWEETYRRGAALTRADSSDKKRRMQHLLDLAVATIVRTIEMSQVERGLTVSSSGTGFFRQNDRNEVFLVYRPGSYCHVQNNDQMEAFGGFGKVNVVGSLNLSGTLTGACGFPNGFFRPSDKNEVYRMYGSGIPEFDIGDRYCHITDDAQMNAYGGFKLVRVVEPNTDVGRGRTFTGDCPDPPR